MDNLVSPHNMKDKRHVLILGIAVHAVLVFAFAISSFCVASTANAGFNVVLTALLNIAFVCGSYYVVKKTKSPLAVGFLIGVAAMMAVLSLMTAIYWGQLSNCEVVSEEIDQYSCSQKAAYGAVSAFAAMLFIAQSVFFGAVIIWRGELIDDNEVYDDITRAHPDTPYDPTPPSSFETGIQPSTIDL
mmetsp:Transcript_12235/g.18524  ORF Transcript_12235/g.18524 Transcript_12235/m.18524 type:complete len:187 (+) Transcript_12235:86-646(+)